MMVHGLANPKLKKKNTSISSLKPPTQDTTTLKDVKSIYQPTRSMTPFNPLFCKPLYATDDLMDFVPIRKFTIANSCRVVGYCD